MSAGMLMLAAVILPVVCAGLIMAVGERNINLREAVTVLTSLLLFAIVCGIYQNFDNSVPAILELAEPILGLSLAFSLEPLGLMFALVCSFLWIVTSVYSIGYMRKHQEQHQTAFYACFALAIASTMGVAFSANMFSLFIFYELLTLVTYPLVTHSRTEEAKQAGRLYLAYLLGTSFCLLLLAIVWTWLLTGTLDFTTGGVFDEEIPDVFILGIFALYVFGIGKAAIMPLHRWLPAAMVAPTPVSALLHAVAVVKAGVFTILKITVYLFGLDELLNTGSNEWLIYVSGATIVIASFVALRMDDLKARLAYSTISQLSYVILATAILTPLSIVAAAMHIAAHAFGKITLFFAAGSIYVTADKTRVSELDGIGWKMPWTMTAFAIGSLSMIGVPPTVGFISKWYLLQGAFSVENWTALGIIVISTLLNAAYFLPIVYAAFFRKPADGSGFDHGEAPFAIVLALILTALATIVLFMLPENILTLIRLIQV